MNILIDLRSLQSGNISGVEVFTENIVRAMINCGQNHEFFLWTNSKEDLLPNFPQLGSNYSSKEWRNIVIKNPDNNSKGLNFFTLHTKKSNKLFNLILSFLRYPKLDKFVLSELKKHHVMVSRNKFDAVFLPDLRPAPISRNTRKFIFFHDLSFVHFPEAFSRKSRIWHKIVRANKELYEAKRVFVPSNFTKEDVAYTLNLPQWRLQVIYEGVDKKFSPASDIDTFEIKKRYNLPGKFILSLCTLEARKNIKSLINAFDLFQTKYPDTGLCLVVAGKKNSENFADIDLPHPKNVIFTGFIPEEDKVALLSSAYVFAFPSIFEGFGLPVLEAMACGTPVMVSSFTSLPEIVSESAIMFDPTDIEDIALAIEKIYLDQDLRNDLAVEGLRWSKQFTWERAAMEILDTIEKDVQIND